MSVQVRLLGGFGVARDDVPVAADAWGRRQAAQLVQLLALARDRRMHREQVIDALWPGLSWDTAGPRLHKAAHYARRALDDPDAVVLRHELVALFPGRDDVEVDVHEFTRTAHQALQTGDATLAAEALRVVRRPAAARRPLRAVDRRAPASGPPAAPGPPPAPGPVGRRAGRGARRRGRRISPWPGRAPPPATSAGLCVQLERLEQASARRARRRRRAGGRAAARRARAKHAGGQATDRRPGRPPTARRPSGSSGGADVGDRIRAVLDEAGAGRGVTVLVAGPAGVGKSAVLDLADALARRQGWKVARGGASSVEGPWPYSPVLEALSALCRRHPDSAGRAGATTTGPRSSGP